MTDPKTYEMLWDCKYCGTKKLLGKTHRFCPNCGAAQDPASRYYPSDEEKVAVEDHIYTGADLICDSCDTLNSAKAEFCQQCGAPLANAKSASSLGEQRRAEGQTFASSGSRDLSQERFDKEMERVGVKKTTRTGPNWMMYGLIGVAVVVIAGILVALLWKREQSAYVAGRSWEREISIEAYGPQSENNWCNIMPGGAYNVTRRSEQRSSRQVADGEICETVRHDNGDGTFSEREECRTKYRDEPVYDDMCYYTIDRWSYSRSASAVSSSVEDQPRWPETGIQRSGTCIGCEREGQRREIYRVDLREGDKTYTCEVDQSLWQNMPIESIWTFNVAVVTGRPDCGSLKPAAS
jgi:hypothetical protein